jgi:nitrate/TMAO reductase-like tetraheme cytochrome c subunit
LFPASPFGAVVLAGLLTWTAAIGPAEAADSRFARSDSDARYLHQIHLYDADNRRIDPESTTPYSSVQTCGRCHDYETISHGWHFNAFLPDAVDGREAEPWIWTDPRTGTQLPLSYRGWQHTYDPRTIGIDQWFMARKFGGRIPGGGLGVAPEADEEQDAGSTRWTLSGSLDIDCLSCHGVSGSYDFNARREQIAEENFAWAATAAAKLGSVDGRVSRIKDDADPEDESVREKLPKVRYDATRFAADGTVFIDLVRSPQNNACYQCHSQRLVGRDGIEPRLIHDNDVHLVSGMQCVDCHRNGIDHHIVRGSEGTLHPSGRSMVTLSCAGCHLGGDFVDALSGRHDGDENGSSAASTAATDDAANTLAGRLGSPYPAHAGLPPLHFEKLSCTACHGGPLPRDQALGVMTSLAHSLGEKGHRSGLELPRVSGPVYAKRDDGRVYPHRVMWPAFWGSVLDGDVVPLDPEQVYTATRRALRVRGGFVEEIVMPELKRSQLKELLGEDRDRLPPEQWTAEEAAKVDAATRQAGRELFAEKVSAALEALEETFQIDQAAYVSAGNVYVRGDEQDTVKTLDMGDAKATGMVRWPMAHNVRPAGWSLGVHGCTECHSDDAKLFASTVAANGPGPDRGNPVDMATLQGVDPDQRLAWNQLFANRASFKYVIATSLAVLAITALLAAGMLIGRLPRIKTP